MKLRKNSVLVATVTYGNRWRFLSKLIVRALNFSEVSRLIIVANGCDYDIREAVRKTGFQENIILVINDKNLGSANGFYQAMAKAKSQREENLLLLDDDNLPEKEIFRHLKKDGKKILENKTNIVAFYRPRYFKEKFSSGIIEDYKLYRDTFCKFSIMHKVFPKRYLKIGKRNVIFKKCIYSQYSGLLFPLSILSKVDLPKLEYYLYVDDTDFTFRITEAGFNIIIYKNGIIRDMELSWAQRNSEKEMNPYKAIFLTNKTENGFYYIRNRIFFERKYLVKNPVLYWINGFVYLTATFLFYMPKRVKGVKIFLKILQARKDGLHGKLGKM